MIVYSTILRIEKGQSDRFLKAIFDWLKDKHDLPRSGLRGAESLVDGLDVELGPNRGNLEIQTDMGGENADWSMLSARYRHPDTSTHGRTWFVIAAYRRSSRQDTDEISILVRTEEMSLLALAPFLPNRPRLVDLLLLNCAPSPSTPGLQLRLLTDWNSANRWRDELFSEHRRVPFVLVSPLSSPERYSVDPAQLQKLLLGVAQVFAVDPDADPFLTTTVAGKEYSAWDGTVAIHFPPSPAGEGALHGRRFFRKRLAPADFEAVVMPPESLVFTHVLHWMNYRFSKSVVRWEDISIQAASRRFERAKRIAEELGDQQAYGELLESEISRLNRESIDLRGILEEARSSRDLAHLKADELSDEVEAMRDNIRQIASAVDKRPERAEFDTSIRDSLLRFVGGDPGLVDVLRLLEAVYPNRVVVLASAWKSASDVILERRIAKQAAGLLFTLCDDYWERLVAGQSDAEARGVFGDGYAAKEAERSGSSKRAQFLRTFIYEGQEVLMERHLRVGVKQSDAQTWRCHFEWDSKNRRIVIGHCGKHLDFN